ncbi:hypothetical protein ESCO_005819 [Escovopsis weberi]|uniref:Uncharacterized protein n=1 Tax=Escovopsis weberi TaxID=150374 RepID=A0A0M9VUK4_ESCWE|nr:hypothetical protein ESCO_005819 [Escovopsis weberi]
MSSSLYDSTILQSKACFLTLKHILTVAEQDPAASRFPDARLCDDMKPLTFQIYSASNHCEKLIARLTGREWTLWNDDLTGFADMHERIAIILDRLAQVDRETVDAQGPVTKSTAWGPNGLNVTVMTGEAFAHGFGLRPS